MQFNWKLNEPPPNIEPHSEAKLNVLRHYLREYIRTLTNNYRREEFKLDLVDGFSGGGLYRLENGREVSGSPLVMLEEVTEAEFSINQHRTGCTTISADPLSHKGFQAHA